MSGSAKFLFLDMDGVVCINGILKDQLLEKVRQIQDEAGCTVILSSDWRRYKDARAFAIQVLERFGVRIKGHTPIMRGAVVRPLEIVHWLRRFAPRQKMVNFVAVDDRSLLLEDGGHLLTGRFVQTRPLIGLSAICTQKCIDILKNGPAVDDLWWNEVDGGREQQDLSRSVNSLTFYGVGTDPSLRGSPPKPARSRELPETSPMKPANQTRPRTAPSKRAVPGSPAGASAKKQPAAAPLLVKQPEITRQTYAAPAAKSYTMPSKQPAADRYASPLLASPEPRQTQPLNRRRIYGGAP